MTPNYQRFLTLMFLSDLQFVFEKAHVGDSVVDLGQQSLHILHCDAGGEARKIYNEYEPQAFKDTGIYRKDGFS